MPSGVVEDAPPDSNLHQQPEAPEWEKFTTEVCQLINKTRKVKKGKKNIKVPYHGDVNRAEITLNLYLFILYLYRITIRV